MIDSYPSDDQQTTLLYAQFEDNIHGHPGICRAQFGDIG